MRRFAPPLLTLLVLALVPIATAGSAAAVPQHQRVDVSSLTIAHAARSVTLGFAYARTPDNYWGATVLLDSDRRRRGPELGAFFDNQCGSGVSVGPVKKFRGRYVLDWDRMGPWSTGCGGEPGRCARSYRVVRDDEGYVRTLRFAEKRGCLRTRSVRASAEFRSADLSDRETRPSYDHVPGRAGAFTPWVRQGVKRVFRDRT